MSNENFVMSAPAVSAGATGKVPKYVYTVRATALKTMIETAPKGYKRTIFTCEILGPDPIVDAADPAKAQYSVAGRKFLIYLPISQESTQYSDSYNALSSWGYLKEDGSIDIEKFWDDIRAQNLFFQVELESEEAQVRDGAGQPINGPDGKPITKGWQIKFVQPNKLLFRVDPAGPTSGAPY